MTMKQKADVLLAHGTLLTMGSGMEVLEDGAVVIAGDSIVAVGTTETLTSQYAAAETVDCRDCVIMPGLINAHTHVPMTLLRGLADDLRLDVWLYGYMMPVEREFVGVDFCRLGTLLACAEMIRSGVSTFCDMYYYEESIAEATADAGMRAICSQTVLKFPSPDANSYEESLAQSKELIEKWKGHPLIIPGVAPHAVYTSTPEMLAASTQLALEYDVPLHIHVSETALEVEDNRKLHHMRVVPYLEKEGVLAANVVAAHCVHIDEEEMDTLASRGVGAVHCPSANLKLASGVAAVQKMLDRGVTVGIGTDGPASNNDLDMFEEMRLAALIAKGSFADPLAVPAKTALQMATIGGARALHIDHITGSLEVGKRADIAVVDLTRVHQLPRFHRDKDSVYSQLVYATKSTDVRHLMVNGHFLMMDRDLLTLDEDALREQIGGLARRVDAFLATREENLLSKLLAIGGGIVPQETFEIQVKVRLDQIDAAVAALEHSDLTITRSSVRNQYDTYFLFNDTSKGRLRHREDEVLSSDGTVESAFHTITLMGPAMEREYDNSILLTRSRYAAPADRSLRFYREYFKADDEMHVVKHRLRYHVIYRDTDFAINLDTMKEPAEEGHFLEIKSRTWSATDAEHKAKLIGELLGLFDIKMDDLLKSEYVNFMAGGAD
jgi:5-methylthioadenosine/S-adenosylhomocysteine deaminase